MYKLCFYVPESHLDVVKQAVFAAGGGRIGAYDSCCWQSLGQGQFRPLDGSQPYLGQVGQVEHVAEWKVEAGGGRRAHPRQRQGAEGGASL